jgi:hypothetical protein
MTTLRQAAELALDAMKDFDYDKRMAAIEAVEQALAEPEQWKTCRHCGFNYKPPKTDKWFPLEQTEQEPVAWRKADGYEFVYSDNMTDFPTHEYAGWEPLYTAPQQRQWVGLRDEEIWEIFESFSTLLDAIKAAQAKLKEKNHDRT